MKNTIRFILKLGVVERKLIASPRKNTNTIVFNTTETAICQDLSFVLVDASAGALRLKSCREVTFLKVHLFAIPWARLQYLSLSIF